MSDDYHKYIYDRNEKKIVGNFDKAYSECKDVWPTQHDVFIQKFQSILWEIKKRNASVLDIGAGYGDFVAELSKQGIDVTGVEISEAAVKKGQERFPNIKLEVGDLKKGLRFKDQSFDAVLFLGVFWFILDDLDNCLNELDRVLKPNGELFITISMVKDPIGKEIMGSYEDFLSIIRKKFNVNEAMLNYDFRALQKGKPLSECADDLCVRLTKKEHMLFT